MNKIGKFIPLAMLFIALIFNSCSSDQPIEDIHNQNNLTTLSKSFESKLYTESDYQFMMFDLRKNIDEIMLNYKPANMDLIEYKVAIIDGELSVSSEMESEITNAYSDLYNYGYNLAVTNSLEINLEDENEVLALAGLYSPNDDLNADWDSGLQLNLFDNGTQTDDITWGDVGRCALVAIGADILYSLGAESGEGAAKWAVKKLVKTFARVASRFIGPIGTAIAVVSFGICLGEAA